MKKLIVVAAVFFLIQSTHVFAGGVGGSSASFEPQYYAGMGLDKSNFDDGDLGLDDSDSGFRMFVGINLTQNYGFEAGYASLGDYGGTDVSVNIGNSFNVNVDASSFYLAAVGRLPVGDKFSIIGKVGFNRWAIEGNISGSNDPLNQNKNIDTTGVDLMFGIGAHYSINERLGVVVDFMSFDLDGVDVNTTSVGMQFTFGL